MTTRITVARAIITTMSTGQWLTLESVTSQASEKVGRALSVSNVGSRVRELRKGHTIEHRRRGNLHEYRLDKE